MLRLEYDKRMNSIPRDGSGRVTADPICKTTRKKMSVAAGGAWQICTHGQAATSGTARYHPLQVVSGTSRYLCSRGVGDGRRSRHVAQVSIHNVNESICG